MTTDSTWNFQEAASKDRILGVLEGEMDEAFALVGDSSAWESPTACEGWEVRDIVGHLVDATEGYFPGFEIARSGGQAPEPLGLGVMMQRADKSARAFRKVPQEELVGRLGDDRTRILGEFASLSDSDWSGLMVPHPYMGPLPAMFYPMFQLVDYAVHTWDIRQGRDEPHALGGDAADLLVPVIFVLWGATADVSGVDQPYAVGIRTSGRNGGDIRAEVSADGVQFEPGDIDDCAAILEFDPATLVLTGYARMNGGTVRGDHRLASNFRSLFFPI